MSYVTHLQGLSSGIEYPADQLMNLDPEDGRPVQMVLDLEQLGEDYPDGSFLDRSRADMWRFGPLLALDPQDRDDRQHILSLGEGHTPELDYDDHPCARQVGFSLSVKDEGSHHPGWGGNPTRSFKDRGMAMAVSMARRFGLSRLVVPTQGNAGDSLTRYAIAAGMEAVIIMPEDTPMPIQGQVAAMAMRHTGITLELVEGTIREAGARMKDHWIDQGYFNVATFQEPGWRIEGKKTLGLELAEPADGSSVWRVPDVIVYPTGGGTGVLGIAKAFDELQALGLIGSERPRMICVQSSATAPLVKAFETGADDTSAADPGSTLAVGLNVPGGIGHQRVLEIVRNTRGTCLAVEESAIERSLEDAWRGRHWWLSPEGAACLAALPMAVDQNLIRPRERVVVINTGSAEKYLPQLRHLLQP